MVSSKSATVASLLRTDALILATASYSLGAAALRSKVYGTIWEVFDGSIRRRAALATAQDARDAGIGRSRWVYRLSRWLKRVASGSSGREEVEEGILGTLDMIVAYALLRRYAHSSLSSFLFYPLITLPLPLALPHLVAASSSAAFRSPSLASPTPASTSPLVGLLLLAQALPTAVLHELEHVLAILIFRTLRRASVTRASKQVRTHTVRPRGRPVAHPREDETCCICHDSSTADQGPLEAFCSSTSPPFERHLAHRACLLEWFYKREPSQPSEPAARRPPMARGRTAAALSISLWNDIPISVFFSSAGPSSPSLTILNPRPVIDGGEELWRNEMARQANSRDGWASDSDGGESSDDEAGSSGVPQLGGTWGLGRLSSTTVASSASASTSPPPPGVHLRVDPDFDRVRKDAGHPFWWAIEPQELEVLLGSRSSEKTRVVGEVTCARPSTSCPVCRGPLSIQMELGPQAAPVDVPTKRTPAEVIRTSSFRRPFVRLYKIWRRRFGPTSLLNKLLLHTFMRILLGAALKGWPVASRAVGRTPSMRTDV